MSKEEEIGGQRLIRGRLNIRTQNNQRKSKRKTSS